MSSFLESFGTAVYSTLSSGTTKSFLGGGTAGIYMGAGLRGAVAPYVVFTYSSATDYLAQSTIRDVRLQVQALSNQPGPQEALQVLNAVRQDLHDASLSNVSGTVVYCREDGQLQPFIDEGQYWHAIGVWRVQIQEPFV